MKKTLIYDLPTRIFHWLFASMFLGAFFIAKVFDDESRIYPLHMLLGISMAFAVILRIIWGISGSSTAKFSSFNLKPKALVNYFNDVLKKHDNHLSVHNPASSWVAIIMMFLSLALATTGYLMTVKIYKEVFEEMHEIFANAFILVAILHVSGVVLHNFRYRDGTALSMFSGSKNLSDGNQHDIKHSHKNWAILFVVLFVGFVMYLNNGYNREKQNLVIFNKSLQLGDAEEKDE